MAEGKVDSGLVNDLSKMLADNMATTQALREVESKHNLKLQKNKMIHNAEKAVIDALKASANNVAQMGRSQ